MSEIRLNYRIFSTPVLWHLPPDNAPAIAIVTGEEDSAGQRISAVDAYYLDGSRVKGFPALRQAIDGVAPASQLGLVERIARRPAELIAVDLKGRIVCFRSDGSPSFVSGSGNPVRGLLAWPPETFSLGDSGSQAIFLLSRDMSPWAGSRNAVDIVDGSGNSLPGFPIMLESWPEQHSPMLEPRSGRFFLLLDSGSVEGFELLHGRRLPDFQRLLWTRMYPKAAIALLCVTTGIQSYLVMGRII